MEFGEGRYRIGEVAARTGLTPDALRFYERVGLLPRSRRTGGGFRIYTSGALERVRFIKQAQTLGLSLDQIRELVRCLDCDTGRRPSVTALLVARLTQVDARLGELRQFRRTLRGCLRRHAPAVREQDQAGAAG